MKRSDKFRQANREALATVLATIAVIIFWCLAGFGLADSNITSGIHLFGFGAVA